MRIEVLEGALLLGPWILRVRKKQPSQGCFAVHLKEEPWRPPVTRPSASSVKSSAEYCLHSLRVQGPK